MTNRSIELRGSETGIPLGEVPGVPIDTPLPVLPIILRDRVRAAERSLAYTVNEEAVSIVVTEDVSEDPTYG